MYFPLYSNKSLMFKQSTMLNKTSKREMTTRENRLNVAVVIPCFNNEKSIASVVSKCIEFFDTVIVVNDGSIDSTAVNAMEAGAYVITHSTNLGKGAAMKTAAQNVDAEILIFIDGDGQHDPEDIHKLVEPIIQGKADCVIGSRFLSQSKTSCPPLSRKLANYSASFTISLVISIVEPTIAFFKRGTIVKNSQVATQKSKLKKNTKSVLNGAEYRILNGKIKWITDCTSGLRAIKLDSFKKLNLVSDRYEIETEMIFELAKNHLIIAETSCSCAWQGSSSNLSVAKDGLKTLGLVIKKVFKDSETQNINTK